MRAWHFLRGRRRPAREPAQAQAQVLVLVQVQVQVQVLVLVQEPG